MDKIKLLEKENEFLKSKYKNIDPRVSGLNKRERLQYDDFMNDAIQFFQDEKVSDKDKQKLFDSLQEAFFTIKLANKRK